VGDRERRGRHRSDGTYRTVSGRDALLLELVSRGPGARPACPQRCSHAAHPTRLRLRRPKPMLNYALKRIGLGFLILMFVIVEMYAAVFLFPVDPATEAHGARSADLVADHRVFQERADRQSGL